MGGGEFYIQGGEFAFYRGDDAGSDQLYDMRRGDCLLCGLYQGVVVKPYTEVVARSKTKFLMSLIIKYQKFKLCCSSIHRKEPVR